MFLDHWPVISIWPDVTGRLNGRWWPQTLLSIHSSVPLFVFTDNYKNLGNWWSTRFHRKSVTTPILITLAHAVLVTFLNVLYSDALKFYVDWLLIHSSSKFSRIICTVKSLKLVWKILAAVSYIQFLTNTQPSIAVQVDMVSFNTDTWDKVCASTKWYDFYRDHVMHHQYKQYRH